MTKPLGYDDAQTRKNKLQADNKSIFLILALFLFRKLYLHLLESYNDSFNLHDWLLTSFKIDLTEGFDHYDSHDPPASLCGYLSCTV